MGEMMEDILSYIGAAIILAYLIIGIIVSLKGLGSCDRYQKQEKAND